MPMVSPTREELTKYLWSPQRIDPVRSTMRRSAKGDWGRSSEEVKALGEEVDRSWVRIASARSSYIAHPGTVFERLKCEVIVMRVFWAGWFPVFAVLFIWSPAARAQCQADNDCRSGRVCRAGSCVFAACSKDVDCPGNEVCEASVCKSATRGAPVPSPASPQPQQRQEVQEESITALWVAGTITASVGYLMTIVLTAAYSQDSVRGQAMTYVLVPVLGPFILNGSAIQNPQYSTPLVVSGIVQAAGVGMIILGLALHRPVSSPGYSLGDGPSAPRVSVVPSVQGRGSLLLSLAF